ncbi:MAG: NAD(P)H-hydrate dehydratase [Candidatus Omnitrophica bacterium]|nr:NAD(P)H-hydrate dehydratase [Candidatus Omnitrophota bacterium]
MKTLTQAQVLKSLRTLQARKAQTHKGDYGRLLVVAGSPGMSGAAVLCARAALRSGVGLVKVACPESIAPIVAGAVPEALGCSLPETPAGALAARSWKSLEESLGWANTLVVGPGCSVQSSAQNLMRRILKQWHGPMVLDADGLSAAVGHLDLLRRCPVRAILTPHPGEMARLLGKSNEAVQKNRQAAIQELVRESGSVVLLKGHQSLVCDPETAPFMNSTGNPGMASGGTGDVLSGIAGAFVAQGLLGVQGAAAAAYVHGLAGDIAARALGQISVIASDLVDFLPMAFKSLRRN